MYEEVPGITIDRATPRFAYAQMAANEKPSQVVRYSFSCSKLYGPRVRCVSGSSCTGLSRFRKRRFARTALVRVILRPKTNTMKRRRCRVLRKVRAHGNLESRIQLVTLHRQFRGTRESAGAGAGVSPHGSTGYTQRTLILHVISIMISISCPQTTPFMHVYSNCTALPVMYASLEYCTVPCAIALSLISSSTLYGNTCTRSTALSTSTVGRQLQPVFIHLANEIDIMTLTRPTRCRAQVALPAWRCCLTCYWSCRSCWRAAVRLQQCIAPASAAGRTEQLLDLLSSGEPINAVDKRGFTALHAAAAQGHADSVKALLDAGAAPDANGPGGTTPLQLAVLEGHGKVAEALLAGGADANAPNKRGYSALHAAAQKGDDALVQALVWRLYTSDAADDLLAV